MKEFIYTIRHPLGLHARPAGMLAKLARGYGDTVITVAKGDTRAKASQLIMLMSMGVKQGDQVVVAAEGPAEDEAIAAVKALFEENF